jgi:hypothetical protein
MARKLKTYITNLGFFELALAAPSMKAALEAWGLGHNAFQQGFAKETHDEKIVAAAMAKPGVVLKRPVGSKGAFQENATLPKDWSVSADSELPPPKAKKSKAKTARKARPEKKSKEDEKTARAAIISFEREKARREKARAKEAAEEEARARKDRARRERETEKAQAALDRAEARHDQAMAAIEKEQNKLERRARLERERWDEERAELSGALAKARD